MSRIRYIKHYNRSIIVKTQTKKYDIKYIGILNKTKYTVQ